MGYNAKNYTEQGAERHVIGGSLDVVSGGELDIEAGGSLKIGGVAVSARAAEINSLSGAPMDATFAIGGEAANVIKITVQLQASGGVDLAVSGGVMVYLSDNADGSSLVSAAPDGGWAIATDGLLIPLVANKAAWMVSEADGDIDVNITHAAGAKTVYMVIVLANGKLAVSGAITFA